MEELLHHAGEIIADRYRIIKTLGQGGTGLTYLAENLQNNQQVALKALSLHRMTDWKMIELFEREARVLSQLNNAAIPTYLEYFHVDTPQDRSFYIAQQFAEGKSLATLVENGWRKNEGEIKRIAMQILKILEYLHSLTPPVIHRDIKPQNIILREDGQVFLVDFGAVQDTYHHTLMRGSTVVGTYGYMAPEQFRGQSVPATDLYGLGATLIFLLTHRFPSDLPEQRLKIDFRSYVQISKEFADWLEKMLEPDLEDRFPSVKAAIAQLQNPPINQANLASSTPWKPLIGVGIIAALGIAMFTPFRFTVMNSVGFGPNSIRDAAQRGDIGSARKFLQRGIKIDERNHNGETALHWAIEGNNKPMVEFLIANGADVNAKNDRGHTPLLWADGYVRTEIAALLRKHGAIDIY